MAYTPSPNKIKSTYPAIASNFGNVQTDGQRTPMGYGNRLQTVDATGTPVVSPVTVATTQTLIVPQNASQLTVVSATNAIQVSEDSTFAASFAVPAGVIWTFDIANQQNVYLKAASSTVVNFYFTVV